MRGSVYKRESDGKWVGSISLGKDIMGRRKRKTVYGNTKNEVETKLNKLLFEIQTGDYIEPVKDTLIGFLNEYYKICLNKWELTTAELYRLYIDVHIKPYFNDIKLIDIKPIILDKFYEYKMQNERKYIVLIKDKPVEKLSKPLSINSVRKLHSFLKSAFSYAVVNELIKSNPADKVKLNKKAKYYPNVYDETQFVTLLNHVKGTDDEIPIILGGGCGLRRGEVFGLCWNDIDLENGYISIKQTSVRFNDTITKSAKNESSYRTFKIPDYIVNILDRYKSNINPKSNDRVITRWQPGSYSERFKNLLDKFDMTHIRFHDLRHYNAVIMCKYGISDKVAAERLGHAQVSTLRNIYQHVLKDMDTTASDGINSMFVKNGINKSDKA